ncbi:MAG: hypothetical protein M1820_003748 [Bogoriella megaspora]|nr:MAG: hypothetical protein M1820_003748 [Bogoriella megaspora]
MNSATLPLVHLVGSVPLETTEEVFIHSLKELAGLINYLPDGETGERDEFVSWQSQVFPSEILYSPFMPPEAQPKPDPNFDLHLSHIKSTGYHKAALASYQTFLKIRSNGTIPKDIRFQVSLPTPLNPVACWVDSAHLAKAESLYETRMLESLTAIQQGIPAHDLAIQWDMAVEPAHMEHSYGRSRPDFAILKPWYSPVDAGIAASAARLAKEVNQDVKIGFHLCYGDLGHVHYVQPDSIGILVQLANLVYKAVSPIHGISWIHMPVPKDRTDESYLEPLKRLEIGVETDLILGLVHPNDEEGTRMRVEKAGSVLRESRRRFGVATECGLGRTEREEVQSIWKICREITKQD